jgi:hypothetical protein
MDQEIRNKLRNVVTQCRKLLEESVSQELEGKYGIFAKKDQVTADPNAKMSHLSEEEQAARKDILDHFGHIKARGFKLKEALDHLVREIAFTHLNRLCAYKMMEAREVYVGGQKFREAVSRGVNSNGVKFYLADHPAEERLFNTGHQDIAYRHFLDWLGGLLSEEIGVLFNPNDPANRLYPRQKTLDEVLDLLNGGGIKPDESELREAWPAIWEQDETIGWVYQYFTPKELRDQARKESQAPRNSYELAFRNQFFTPRYVVEFLTDNTLGRIWYEMRHGDTRLKDECRYLVRRPDEVFLADLSDEARDGEKFPLDIAFLRGEEVDFPAFTVPVVTRHPAKQTKPGVFPMGWVDFDEAGDRLRRFARAVRSFDWARASRVPEWMRKLEEWSTGNPDDPVEGRTQDLWDLLYAVHRAEHFGAGTVAERPLALTRIANEIRRRVLVSKKTDASKEDALRAPDLIPHRPKKDPREIKILDPACGSGHFLLYCLDLLLVIYEEAYDDPNLGPTLQEDYPTPELFRQAVPGLILARNLHGIDIDPRAAQIAALALWLRAQRAYKAIGMKSGRPAITRSNVVCAEPMPGEESLLSEFLKTINDDRLLTLMRRVQSVADDTDLRATRAMADSLGDLVRSAWREMTLAGEVGSLLKVEDSLQNAIVSAQSDWEEKLPLFRMTHHEPDRPATESYIRTGSGERDTFWSMAEGLVLAALEDYAGFARGTQSLVRRLFADDAAHGFALIDVCRLRFDVVLMNPPFGDGSKAGKSYIEKSYPRTKNDLYAAFVEQGLNRLDRNGMLGAITSRTGFFLSSFQNWREEVLLGNADPTVFADLGYGVLDTAMVETAAYCLRKSLAGKNLRGDHGQAESSTTLAPLNSVVK